MMHGSEIWSATDRVFCHLDHFFFFNPLTTPKIKILKKGKKPWRYYLFTHVYDKWQSNDLWLLRYGVQWTEFFVILEPFWHFYPPSNLKNQTFEKNEENTRRYYHFTHVYHKWQPSWDMEHDGHNFLSFWTIFCPFTPLTTQKIKILKKGKKPWRYYHFTHVYY